MTVASLVLAATLLQPKLKPALAQEIATVILEVPACANYDPLLILSVIQPESSFNPRKVNPITHAAGLMQILPVHWGRLSLKQVLNVRTNIELGCAILARYDDRGWSIQRRLSAYNGHTKAVSTGYSRSVIGMYERLKETQ